MATYVIEIPEQQEQCITAARQAYNSSIPPMVPDPEVDGGMMPNPDVKLNNDDYMKWVMQNAVTSYCRMYFPT